MPFNEHRAASTSHCLDSTSFSPAIWLPVLLPAAFFPKLPAAEDAASQNIFALDAQSSRSLPIDNIAARNPTRLFPVVGVSLSSNAIMLATKLIPCLFLWLVVSSLTHAEPWRPANGL
jgi:hypothetical protein